MNPRTLVLLCTLALFGALPVKAGLIGLYTFDDSGNPFNDSSGAANHITGTAGTDPIWGAALGFNSTGAYDYSLDRLVVPINVNASVMPQMSWGAWVRTDTVASGLRKVIGHDDGAWDRTIGLDNRNTNAGGGSIAGPFRYTGFTGLGATGPVEGTLGPLNTTSWAFICATYDQAQGTMTFYMDQDASSTADALISSTEVASFGPGAVTMAIGGISPANNGEAWDGVIDQVFVYNEVITPEKVGRIRNRGLPELQGSYSDPHIELVRALPNLYGDVPFDAVPAAVQRTVTVKNTGIANSLTLTPSISGTNAGSYSIVSAPASIPAGGQGDIIVSLATGGINASFTASLDIANNDPDSPPLSVPLNANIFNRLIGLYTFDESANPFKDESAQLRHITGTAGTDPVWGASTGFNGTGAYEYSGDRLIVPTDINPAVMPKMTWGAWVRTNTTASGLYKALGHDDGAWDRTIGLDNRNPATFRFTTFTGIANGSGPLEGTPGPANTTDWAFIAASYDETTLTTTMYVDANAATTADPLVAISELAGFGAGANTFAIGGISPNNNGEAWAGSIDQVFIYKDVLTLPKMTAIRNRGLLELRNIPAGDPDILVTPAALFGNLTSLGVAPGPVTRTVTITNNGATQNLNISSITVTGPDAASYTAPPLPGPVAPGAHVDLNVVFTPAPAGGSFTANLNIVSNDEDTPTSVASLNATVTTDPNIEVTAPAPLFGGMVYNAVPASIQRTVTVKNAGVVNTLTVNAPSVSGPDAVKFSILTTPATLPPGTQGDIVVSYVPTAAGTFSASLSITSSDPDAGTIVVSLDGAIVLVPPATLFAFYPFDDAGNPLRDESGGGHDITGTAGTDPVWGATSGLGNTGAFEFTLDQLIAPIDVNPAAMPQMTWGAFVRSNALVDGNYKILGHDNGGYDRTVGLDMRPNNVLHYSAFLGTGVTSGTVRPVNTTDWAFIAAAYDQASGLIKLYVDGNAATTADALETTVAATNFNPGWPTFAIGGIRPDVISESWDGTIDNVFVYSGILTDDQVKNIRDQGRAAILPSNNFVVTSWQINPDGKVTLTWNSRPGETYTLRYSLDLEGPVDTWADETDDIASGGTTTTYTTGISFSSARRVFFSVERN